MLSYALLAIPFIGVLLALDWFVLKTRVLRDRQTWFVMHIMMACTFVFDNIMNMAKLLTHNPEKYLVDFKFAYMPIEDISYTFAAVIGLSMLLKRLHR